MTQIHRSALLPYSAEQLFDLVNDVSCYPQYLDGCVAVDIIEQNEEYMTARLHLQKGGVQQSFATRNQLDRPRSITLSLVEGAFDNFQGQWNFDALASHACKVSLDLTFSMQRSISQKAVEKLFETMAGNLVDAICQRAKQIYG